MFLAWLFVSLIRSDANSYTYEIRHEYNPNCEDYEVAQNGDVTFDDNNGIGVSPYLRECNNIRKVTFKLERVPNYCFYHSSVTSITFDPAVTTSIGEGAFAYCTKLQSVDFGAGSKLNTISSGAFCNSNLQNILNFPDGVTQINSNTFQGCPFDQSFTFNLAVTKVRSIDNYAFYGSGLVSVTFHSETTKIGNHAFENCQKLTIGGNIINSSSIGDYAFYNCPSVTGITIVTESVGKHAFHAPIQTNRLTISRIEQRLQDENPLALTISDYAFYGRSIGCSNAYHFYDLTINQYAFAECVFNTGGNNNPGITIENMNSVNLVIGVYAFYNCNFGTSPFRLNLTSQNDGNSIGYHAFELTKGSLKLTIENKGSLEIQDYAFNNSAIANTYSDDSEEDFIVLPTCVSSIGKKAFANCANIRGGLVIYTKVGENAFYQCRNLQGPIVVHGNSIGEGAFEGCTGTIKNLTITYDHPITGDVSDRSKISIGNRAFYGCTGLQSPLILHSFISSIGEYAFAYCTSLGSAPITIYANEIKPYAFLNCGTFQENITIYSKEIGFHCFDNGDLNNLTIISKNDPNEDKHNILQYAFYAISIRGYVTITKNVIIGSYAFAFTSFQQLILIDSETINSYAFYRCVARSANVKISIGISTIGYNAFERFGDQNAYTLIFHDEDHLENKCSIGSEAFMDSTLSSQVIIPERFRKINDKAFYNCNRINYLRIENADIGESAFEGCTGIQTLILHTHGDMHIIKERAFYGLNFNSELNIPYTVKRILDSAFENCRSLPGVVIPANSELGEDLPSGYDHIYESEYNRAFGNKAFNNCGALRGEILIPSNVEYIGNFAFNNCSVLQRFSFFNDCDLKQIGDYAFCNCEALDGYLDIPTKVNYIGHYAFYNCQSISHHLKIQSACSIGNYSFYGCNKINRCDLIFPESIAQNKYYIIGDFAFTGLPISEALSIPGYYEEIGESAFENTTNIANAYIQIKNPYHTGSNRVGRVGRRAFYNSGINSLEIGGSDTFIVEEYAFANCLNLRGPIEIGGGIFVGHAFEGCINIGPDEENYFCVLYMYGGKLAAHNFDGCTNFNGQIRLSDTAIIGQSAFEGFSNGPISLYIYTGNTYNVQFHKRAFYGSTLTGPLVLPYSVKVVGDEAFANLVNPMISLTLGCKGFGKNVFANTKFNDTLTIRESTSFDQFTLRGTGDFKKLEFDCSSSYTVPFRAFYGITTFEGTLTIPETVNKIKALAFAETSFNDIQFGSFTQSSPLTAEEGIFSNCKGLNGTITIPYFNGQCVPDKTFSGCSNIESIILPRDNNNEINIFYFRRGAFEDCSNLRFDLIFNSSCSTIYKNSFAGCSSLEGVLNIPITVLAIEDFAFKDCGFSYLHFEEGTRTSNLQLGEGVFSGWINLIGEVFLPKLNDNAIPDRLFEGCSKLPAVQYHSDTDSIGKYAFRGCSSLHGPLDFSSYIHTIKEYAFAGCKGFSDSLTIRVDPETGEQKYIGAHAFDGCSGFKKGTLTIFVETDEESNKDYFDINSKVQNYNPYFRYQYFLRIGNQAFEGTDFKNIYYNGRYQPDCDYDIGFSHTKGIHTSSNYLNKTFCSYPLHSNKLSGGAIAGITIAVIVVVAVIVFLIIFFILRNKKNKDKSEDEVEMNADP